MNHHRAHQRRHPLARSLAAALAVTTWLLASGVVSGAGAPPPDATATLSGDEVLAVASRSYVVQPGDTLWSVARSMRPAGDVRPLVDLLGRQTGGRPLRPGQRLSVP